MATYAHNVEQASEELNLDVLRNSEEKRKAIEDAQSKMFIASTIREIYETTEMESNIGDEFTRDKTYSFSNPSLMSASYS